MNRENASFLLGGIFFGFLVGFSLAYFVYHEATSAPPSAALQAPLNASDPMGVGSGAAVAQAPKDGQQGQAATQTMEQVQQEIGVLRQALQRNPKDGKAQGRLGDLFYDAGMFDKARDYYVQSLQNEPNNPNVSTDLGICYQRLGQPDEAIKQFRHSLELDPRHWQSWLNLGIVSLFDENDTKTAEEAFAKVKELNPTFEGLAQFQQALDHVKAGGK
jgi:tetratricopeptide (TPR) repeat protein